MTRRQLYQFVAERASGPHGARTLLRDCIAAMRTLRDMPATLFHGARELLDDRDFVKVLREDDALGQIYQAINAPKLEAAYRRTARDRAKFAEHEISAVTQLFTPRWVVEMLLSQTLGPPGRFSDQVPYADIRILDPACGTMNFGVVAIERLETMYREEMDQAGRPGWPAEPSVRSLDQIPDAIVEHNLVGIDIDPVALELASETIEIKLTKMLNRSSNAVRVAGTRLRLQLGNALVDRFVDENSFDVVVTNPPYLSSRNLPADVVRTLKHRFPRAWRDTYACFIERCLQFVRPGGRIGMLTMHSFMFTGGFEKLRRHIYDTAAIETIEHFGPGLFDIGNPGTLQTVAMVLRRDPDETARQNQPITAQRLVDADDKQHANPKQYVIRQGEMRASPRGAWIYWLSEHHREMFARFPRLCEIAPPRQGLATTDNARFVRYWWEVEPTTPNAPCRATEGMWLPYVKSGRFRRWHESPRHRVNWLDDGRDIKRAILARYPYLNGKWQWVAKNTSFYGRAGVTYSYLTSGRFSARRLDAGAIFDVAGSSMFPDDPLTLLAVLNSSVAQHLLAAINPTVNFQVDLAQLPVPTDGTDELRTDVARAIELQRRLDTFDETAPDFVAPLEWARADELHSAIHTELYRVERRIERQIQSLYGLDEVSDEPTAPGPVDRPELARNWISFAVGRLLGRWGGAKRVDSIPVYVADTRVTGEIRSELASLVGDSSAHEIESSVGGIERFLARQFFGWHVKLYHGRPVLWLLGASDRASLLLHDHATAQCVEQILQAAGVTKPNGRWGRFIDDGVQVNLSPLWKWVTHRPMQKALAAIDLDCISGRLAWSATSSLTRASTREDAGAAGRRRRAGAARCR